ncbi:MAG: diphosphate--fructose-6-phosphate 1-phosphotransferase [Desulfobacterales bacterium C00003060]|nr:MAG: diphosphate--fructose-6-phosphate 1-phosphotransferase [Desulfobacterales bacterium S3730MH5]OEU79845.1 MAG: diphosphate--fructose-6-phosphate 1-phosphotransferase [Desulfobacterales bacterium S5133MH4]OEU80070.1 MAG: diphosphate--fructose-6-phosphate 1-phosphotransferase [Desulfobacterales bacterium C00003060]
MKSNEPIQNSIMTLGPAKIPSPLRTRSKDAGTGCFVSEKNRVLVNILADHVTKTIERGKRPVSFEQGGPRSKLFFDPTKLRCAVVSCGGLCPGVNDVIRAIVLALYYNYGLHNIYGIRYGLQGFISSYGHEVMDLTPESVAHIHERGGTILGSSRGHQEIGSIVDSIERMNVGLLFGIGGDGTMVACAKIADEITNRGLKIGVIGIPKTIDNDIYLVDRSFGFDTAVGIAVDVIAGAHNEAISAPNGIGVVKVMGRYSGFIAAAATLAMPDVNFVLIPESDFELEGPEGLLEALKERLIRRKHAVIVVAEGTGQKFFTNRQQALDPSGNIRPHDIGIFLKDTITAYFKDQEMEINLKYIDPSYTIRSASANANDHLLCGSLARNAVHAGMAGKTRMLVGLCNNQIVHIPMEASVGKRKHVDWNGDMWMSVLETTGQPPMKN